MIQHNTPLWKSNDPIFDTFFCLLFFVVYPYIHKWHTWGSQYELRYFLLDFHLWSHPSDTLKTATISNPDVAPVWPMQRAWITSKHGENECYLRVVRMQEVHISYYKLSENLVSYICRFICDLLGMRAVEKSYPRPLAGIVFHLLCLRGLCYRDKDASGASRNYGAVYQASTRPSAGVDTFVQLPPQNQS